MAYWWLLATLVLLGVGGNCENDEEMAAGGGGERFKIEGKITRPEYFSANPLNWFANTKVYTNSGHFGFIKEDGSFVIHNVPWGSHVVHVMNSDYSFEPTRVDISSKGKFRARAVNNIQPALVVQMPYPLRLKSSGQYRYFQQREQWRLTDLFMNPMVLMTVLPLALMMLLPRLSDPETRKEMENLQMPKPELPDMSEIMTNLLSGRGSGGGAQRQQKAVRPGKRKDK